MTRALARNVAIVTMQAEGLDHAQSLLQTEFNTNCLNWVIGHIGDGRDAMLKLLGEPPFFDEESISRYRRESDPILADGDDVIQLGTLLEGLVAQQVQLATSLSGTTEADLAARFEVGERMSSIAGQLFFAYFHDTYHTGQTELLRQVAGTNDALI